MIERRGVQSLSNYDSCAKCDAYLTSQRFGRRSDGLTNVELLVLPDVFLIHAYPVEYATANRHLLVAGRVGPEPGLWDVGGPADLVM